MYTATTRHHYVTDSSVINAPGSEVIELFPFSTRWSMKSILLIYVKIPTIWNSFLLYWAEHEFFSCWKIQMLTYMLIFIRRIKFMLSWNEHGKFYNLMHSCLSCFPVTCERGIYLFKDSLFANKFAEFIYLCIILFLFVVRKWGSISHHTIILSIFLLIYIKIPTIWIFFLLYRAEHEFFSCWKIQMLTH